MKLNITPSVQKMLTQNYNQEKTTIGYLLAGKSENNWNSNTAIITDKTLDMILKSKEHTQLNAHLQKNENAKIIPFITCQKIEDAKDFLQNASENSYNLCITITPKGAELYQTEKENTTKHPIRIVSYVDNKSNQTINNLMDIIITEHKNRQGGEKTR